MSGSEQYAYQGDGGAAPYRARGGEAPDGYGRGAPQAAGRYGRDERNGYDPLGMGRGSEPARAAGDPYRDDRRAPAADDRQRGYGATAARGGAQPGGERWAGDGQGQYDDRYAAEPSGGRGDRWTGPEERYDDRYAGGGGQPGGERWAGEGRYATPAAPAGGRYPDDGYGAPAAPGGAERGGAERGYGGADGYYDDRTTAVPDERGYGYPPGSDQGRGGDPLGIERAGGPAGRAATANSYGTCPRCRTPHDGASPYCVTCGFDLGVDSGGMDAGGTGTGWDATVEAEREYYDSGDDHRVPFPTTYQRRVFSLTGHRLLIGRRSESRNIHPEIDLSGAPEDPGVSRSHAMFEQMRDGSYAVVDPGSTNGTRINDEPNPIPPNQPIPLADGDRVYVGAWTRITVRLR